MLKAVADTFLSSPTCAATRRSIRGRPSPRLDHLITTPTTKATKTLSIPISLHDTLVLKKRVIEKKDGRERGGGDYKIVCVYDMCEGVLFANGRGRYQARRGGGYEWMACWMACQITIITSYTVLFGTCRRARVYEYDIIGGGR